MNQDLLGSGVAVVQLIDVRHLKAAEGYLELGMQEEADTELGEINPTSQILTFQFQVYARMGKWELLQAVARRLARNFPNDTQWRIWWATAASRAQSVESAKSILLEALETHPNDPNIHYNLSCYESRLQHFHKAQRHLARAIQLDGKFHLIALNDEDLMPLWLTMAARQQESEEF